MLTSQSVINKQLITFCRLLYLQVLPEQMHLRVTDSQFYLLALTYITHVSESDLHVLCMTTELTNAIFEAVKLQQWLV